MVMTSDRQQVPVRLSGYRIKSKLGQGGMSTVYLATQRRMDRLVALKVLSPERSADQSLRARFLREGRLAGRINHTNVVTYHELREIEGWMFMALEYIDGGDLMQLLKDRGGRLPERLALGIARDIGCGLEAVAQAGVVHRDIKPHNIFVTKNMIPKIADFSASQPSAAALQAEDVDRKAGLVIGSPAYMAPEQCVANKHVDIRADIYGLGCTLFHLLTGQPPFKGANARETIKKVVSLPPPDPQDHSDRQLAVDTRDVVMKAMEKKPEDRFATPREFVEALEASLHAGFDDLTPAGLPQAPRRKSTETGEMDNLDWAAF